MDMYNNQLSLVLCSLVGLIVIAGPVLLASSLFYYNFEFYFMRNNFKRMSRRYKKCQKFFVVKDG